METTLDVTRAMVKEAKARGKFQFALALPTNVKPQSSGIVKLESQFITRLFGKIDAPKHLSKAQGRRL